MTVIDARGVEAGPGGGRAGWIAWLEGWRGLCILLVLAGHFLPALGFTGFGFLANVGVEFFFALSGRLMARLLIAERQPARTFVIRRFFRVVPAAAVYIATIAALLLAAAIANGIAWNWHSPLAALLFVHNYLPAPESVWLLQHSWSLAVEEHAYLLLLILALCAGRRPGVAMAAAFGIVAIALANLLVLAGQPLGDQQSLFIRSDVRVASVALSFALQISVSRGGGPRSPCLPLLLAALPVAAYGLLSPTAPATYLLALIGAAGAVNLLDGAPARVLAWLSHPAIRWAGRLSFSLYLWQQLPYALSYEGAPLGMVLPVLAVTAVLSHRMVERPCHALARRLTGAGAAPPAPALQPVAT